MDPALMSVSPAITVLMPVYNGEIYLAQAIQSILDQTFGNFELLIIDDGSTDHTPGTIKQFSDPRIRVVNHDKNLGLIETLNRGIEMANGRYIARMDCDDLSVSDRLAKQWNFMESHPSVGVCGSWVKAFRESEEQLWRYPESNADIRCRLLFSSMLAHPSVMMRKTLLEKHHLQYSSEHIYAEDYELWSRCMDVFALANLPVPLLHYRLHVSNTGEMHSSRQKQTVMKIQSVILKRIGIDANESQLDLHYHIGRGGLTIGLDTLDRVDKWLTHLAVANRAAGYFPEPEFERTLGLYWLDVCRSMQSLGPVVGNRFSKSEHIKGLSSPLFDRVKLEIRLRVHRHAR